MSVSVRALILGTDNRIGHFFMQARARNIVASAVIPRFFFSFFFTCRVSSIKATIVTRQQQQQRAQRVSSGTYCV